MADGAEFTKTCTHVSVGIKMTNHCGRHPITKRPLFVQDKETGSEATYLNVQSRGLCCIPVMADAHDSKVLYTDVFTEYYKVVEELQNHGGLEALRMTWC